MRHYKFLITEYDPDCPWLVLSNERREVELEDDVEFYSWAVERWPKPRYVIRRDA